MRIFIAGATGVIGIRLLVAGGHAVAGMTRSPGKAGLLAGLGAEPVVCDVFDAGPGTYYQAGPPAPPRIHVDDAARLTVPALGAPPGLTIVADDRAVPD